MRSSFAAVVVLALTLCVIGCSQVGQSPLGQAGLPTAPTATPSLNPASVNITSMAALKPGYEPAYYNGSVVTINAIDVPVNQGPLEHAAADFYLATYTPDKSLWPDTPQCNPCDHAGDGITFDDFHDHVLDSIPSDPGHDEFSPLWHVFLIIPSDFSHAGQVAYAKFLPMKSEAQIDAALAAGVAQKIDTQFYFICAVVSPHAAGR